MDCIHYFIWNKYFLTNEDIPGTMLSGKAYRNNSCFLEFIIYGEGSEQVILNIMKLLYDSNLHYWVASVQLKMILSGLFPHCGKF